MHWILAQEVLLDLLVPKNELFEVLACEQLEHPKRAMLDGQIEDIAQVAQIAGQVNNAGTSNRTNFAKCCCCCCRARLKTSQASFEKEVTAEAMNAQFIYDLKMGAVNEARLLLEQNHTEQSYYCVGHSVVQYSIDGYPFTSLLNHNW